jgi:hypothetical protein
LFLKESKIKMDVISYLLFVFTLIIFIRTKKTRWRKQWKQNQNSQATRSKLKQTNQTKVKKEEEKETKQRNYTLNAQTCCLNSSGPMSWDIPTLNKGTKSIYFLPLRSAVMHLDSENVICIGDFFLDFFLLIFSRVRS